MSTTINTDRGCAVTVAVGPAPDLVRLELYGAVPGSFTAELVVAVLTPAEARRVAAELLARVAPGASRR